MSVKSKIKYKNKKIEELQKQVKDLELKLLDRGMGTSRQEKLYENIIKFVVTNQIGRLKGGMMADCYSIDKMSELKLDIERSHTDHAYIMRVRY